MPGWSGTKANPPGMCEGVWRKVLAEPPALMPCLEGMAHHWVIEEAQGPVSKGVCRHCGDAREFQNSVFEDSGDWKDRALHLSQRRLTTTVQRRPTCPEEDT